MKQEIELRRYLLGELPLEEEVLAEQRLFLDSDYVEALQAVEDELIDEYLADELVGSERERFEKHFLRLPEHGADLRIAQALKKYLATGTNPSSATGTNHTSDDEPAPVPPIYFFNRSFKLLSLAVAALIVLSIVAWIVFRSTRGPAAEAPLHASDPKPANTQPNDRQQPPAPSNNDNKVETVDKGNTNESGTLPDNSDKPHERQATATHIATYPLFGGGSPRAVSSQTTIVILPGTTAIELQLVLEFNASYEKYRAELLRGERRIDRWDDLKSVPDEKHGQIVSVQVSVDRLRDQSFRIKLHGIPGDQQTAEQPIIYRFNVQIK